MSFKNTCRTCLHTGGIMVPMFQINLTDTDSPAISIVDLLKMFTKILIYQNDGFPQQICSNCLEEIKQLYEFKVKCEQSAENLIKIFQDNLSLLKVEEISDSNVVESIEIREESFTIQNYNSVINSQNEIVSQIDSCMEETIIKEEPDENLLLHISPKATTPSFLNEENTTERTSNVSKEEAADDDAQDCDTMSTLETISNDYESEIIDSTENTIVDNLNYSAAKIMDREEKPENEKDVSKCSACSDEFPDSNMLRSHIIDSHTDGDKCLICDKDRITKMYDHCVKHLPRKVFFALLGSGFTRRSLFTENYECKECNVKFDREELLRNHRVQVHDIHFFQCNICSEEFQTRNTLYYHRTIHSGQRTFKCSQCGNRYQSKTQLSEHLKWHRKIRCTLCPKEFKHQDVLHIHMKRVHPEKTEKHARRCDICSKILRSDEEMEKHKERHMESKEEFKCDICSRRFQKKGTLSVHLRTVHSTERGYRCDYCFSTYKSSYYLNKHKNIAHKDEFQRELTENEHV